MQPNNESMSDTSLLEKRYQLMLSMNQKKWEQKFAEMEARFAKLSDQVTAQLSKMNGARPQPAPGSSMGNYHSPQQMPPQMGYPQQMQPNMMQQQMGYPQEQNSQQARGMAQRASAQAEHPRSSGNSEDVSIEKYFYCGNKK